MSTNYPTISIIVPVFNRADLIGETLDAILSQTRPAEEIIVVDDGSTDETPAVLRQYEPRIHVIRITNSGDMKAKNTGLQMARGDLAAFCDSDDLWQSDYLQSMARFWQMRPDMAAAYANFRELRAGELDPVTKFDKAPREFWNNSFSPEDDSCYGWFTTPIVDQLLDYQPFFPSAMVVDRQKFIAMGGWDESVSRLIGCDFATTLRVAGHPPIGFHRQPLVHIRKHVQNFSGDIIKMHLGDAKVLSVCLQNRPELADHDNRIERSIAQRRMAALDLAFAKGDFTTVREIEKLLQPEVLPRMQKLKTKTARLPAGVRKLAWRILTQLGTMRGRFGAARQKR